MAGRDSSEGEGAAERDWRLHDTSLNGGVEIGGEEPKRTSSGKQNKIIRIFFLFRKTEKPDPLINEIFNNQAILKNKYVVWCHNFL